MELSSALDQCWDTRNKEMYICNQEKDTWYQGMAR